jgi:hypothetical protein
MFRSFAFIIVGIIALVLLMVFITLFLKIAFGIALLALAYYWFVRASESRRRRFKHWR